jgi:hypothetical protein
LTVLRVIRGGVGAYREGDTFVAEEVGADVTHLLSVGAVQLVSGEAPPQPAGYTAEDRAVIDSVAERVIALLGKIATDAGVPVKDATLGSATSAIEGIIDKYIADRAAVAAKVDGLVKDLETANQRASEIGNDLAAVAVPLNNAAVALGITLPEGLISSKADALAKAIAKFAADARNGEVLKAQGAVQPQTPAP